MKSEWFKLFVSALTDFGITAITAYLAMPADTPLTQRAILTVIAGGGLQFLRTVQQALKATPEVTAALKGDPAPKGK